MSGTPAPVNPPQQPNPNQPIPPMPAGPLNAPVYGPRLPGHPGPHQQGMVPPPNPIANPSGFEPTLPVVQTDYPNFWRTPAWRVLRPILALGMGVGLFFIGLISLVSVAVVIDSLTGRADPLAPDYDPTQLTAMGFLSNNLSLAALIPIALAASWLIFKQRPGHLVSVAGTLRWGWLVRCMLVILPLWVAYSALDIWLVARAGQMPDLAVNRDTWVMVIGILLTTPIQAAGEEFGFRGLINRSVASFFRKPVAGLIAGGLASTLVFTAAHGALDPWLNVYYFSFGVLACFVTWRTGGLEGAIAMHVVNNMLAEIFLPFSDISGMFNREVGSADARVLIGVAVVATGSLLIVWQAKRHGIVRTAAPGESMHAALLNAPMPPPGQPMAPPPQSQPTAAPPPQSQPTAPQPPLVNPRPWDDGLVVG